MAVAIDSLTRCSIGIIGDVCLMEVTVDSLMKFILGTVQFIQTHHSEILASSLTDSGIIRKYSAKSSARYRNTESIVWRLYR
jgi:hypothetical protein